MSRACFLACFFATFAYAQSELSIEPSFIVPDVEEQYYFESLERLKAEDPAALSDIDFVMFRRAFLEASENRGLEIPQSIERAYDEELAKEAPDPDKVIELCDEILAVDYTDLNRHVLRNYFREEKGEDVGYGRELVRRLFDSIFDSGDGQTPQTAFHVFQVKEEYEVLKMFRLTLIEQTLFEVGDRHFDMMQCEDAEGKVYEIYFDITERMRAIRNGREDAMD